MNVHYILLAVLSGVIPMVCFKKGRCFKKDIEIVKKILRYKEDIEIVKKILR